MRVGLVGSEMCIRDSTHTHTHTQNIHKHTHTHNIHTHARTHARTHTHTHIPTLPRTHSHSPPPSLSLFLFLPPSSLSPLPLSLFSPRPTPTLFRRFKLQRRLLCLDNKVTSAACPNSVITAQQLQRKRGEMDFTKGKRVIEANPRDPTAAHLARQAPLSGGRSFQINLSLATLECAPGL